MDAYIKSEGFDTIGFEESVWVRPAGGKYSEDIYVSAHVDDCLLSCKSLTVMAKFKAHMLERFIGDQLDRRLPPPSWHMPRRALLGQGRWRCRKLTTSKGCSHDLVSCTLAGDDDVFYLLLPKNQPSKSASYIAPVPPLNLRRTSELLT